MFLEISLGSAAAPVSGVEPISGMLEVYKCLKVLAPQVGLEPTTLRLTAIAVHRNTAFSRLAIVPDNVP